MLAPFEFGFFVTRQVSLFNKDGDEADKFVSHSGNNTFERAESGATTVVTQTIIKGHFYSQLRLKKLSSEFDGS
jgi:hypothetical protein